jgi:large subunit ribosomal protein L25
MIKLQANLRSLNDKKTSVSMIRENGNIPAVVYGPKFANTSIDLNYQDFIRFYNKNGETTLLSLDIAGEKKQTVNVLVKDIDLHPVSNKVIHIDFYAPEAGKKVTVSIPVEFVGESAAVKAGAQLVKVLHEIEVEALPENLPHSVEADLSIMTTVDISVHVKDIKFPAGVTCELDADEVVASCVEYVEEAAETVAVDLSKIEVAKKGKKEEEAATE